MSVFECGVRSFAAVMTLIADASIAFVVVVQRLAKGVIRDERR
jgi:hypothetical protein